MNKNLGLLPLLVLLVALACSLFTPEPKVAQCDGFGMMVESTNAKVGLVRCSDFIVTASIGEETAVVGLWSDASLRDSRDASCWEGENGKIHCLTDGDSEFTLTPMSTPGATGPFQDQMAPDFTIENLDGESFSFSDVKGQKIVINYWEDWCPHCKEEFPHLVEVAKYYHPHVLFLHINGEDDDETIQALYKGVSLPKNFIALRDKGNFDRLYRIEWLPTTLIIDENGTIIFRGVGFNPDFDWNLYLQMELALK